MTKSKLFGSASILAIGALALTSPAHAENFNIPAGDLKIALNTYASQSGVLVVSSDAVNSVRSRGVRGDMSAHQALAEILRGTGFVANQTAPQQVEIIPAHRKKTSEAAEPVTRLAEAASAHAAAAVETVVVTSSKIKGDIQTVPIAITALSQEQLTERQIAGGPDLVKEVPNLTFSKTNFTGYNLEIRGIGTQAISVTTDPAVAVAFNDTPFIRNHFFEQEFYDVSQVEVLRGPQGTLYGRNATAGVVNVVSAKPTDHFEAMLSADWGNFSNRRYEGMINIPIVGDKLDLRVAGEWTKRDGYVFNQVKNNLTDGRDLWSSRVSLRWQPTSDFHSDFIWEHFQESDDRLRSGKQLCKTDPGPASFTYTDGVTHIQTAMPLPNPRGTVYSLSTANFSQGCLPNPLYDKGDPAHGDYGSFGVVNGFSLGFVSGLAFAGVFNANVDPYASAFQSTDLRNIQSEIDPRYLANNDTLELNSEWNVAPSLTLDSDTGYNRDFLWSTEDFNRFETNPDVFVYNKGGSGPYYYMQPDPATIAQNGGLFCDPQLGCSDRLVVQDLSSEHSWQFSQEFRLSSDFKGPFNFSAGGNYLHYETIEDYYVFSNALTMISLTGCGAYSVNYNQNPVHDTYVAGVDDNLWCMGTGHQFNLPFSGAGVPTTQPSYVDPNPLTSVNGQGHNYFVSHNPYVLNSYALFGETYYNITKDLKLTGGLRWTYDEKHFPEYPSRVVNLGYGVQRTGAIDQTWRKFTGRAVASWTPKLDFTDQTMVYASLSHGYKAGGANPPSAVETSNGGAEFPVHPLTFKPEFINAYELGTKNTFLDGGLVFNADAFYYDYTGYQISQIVDRTSVNINVDATVEGAELQTTWTPLPGLNLGFSGGYENTRIKNNQYFIDLMDRNYGHHDTWAVMKPWVGESSNCIFPINVAAAIFDEYINAGEGSAATQACGNAYYQGLDPVTRGTYEASWQSGAPGYSTYGGNSSFEASHNLVNGQPYFINFDAANGHVSTIGGYPYTISGKTYFVGPNGSTSVTLPPLQYYGFDPATACAGPHGGANCGQGFAKPIGGNALPNAPHFTVSLTGDYTIPVSANWAATFHTDFYWQSQSWARIFNDPNYDKIRGYANINLALILNDATGWQVMGYVKNIFDTTAITGDFLNSDDTGLTTNIFVTDPRLYGVRITKRFEDGDGSGGGFSLFSGGEGKRPIISLQLGGNFNAALADSAQPYSTDFKALNPNYTELPAGLVEPNRFEKVPNSGLDWEGKLTFQPEGSDWKFTAGIRYGRSSHNKFFHKSLPTQTKQYISVYGKYIPCSEVNYYSTKSPLCSVSKVREFEDFHGHSSEKHLILDFTMGKDVGVGLFGEEGTGTLGGGLRVAQFDSIESMEFNTDPTVVFVPDRAAKYHDIYDVKSKEHRSFHGMGPEVTWDADQPVWGDPQNGQISIDWGVNAAVLFGRQKMDLHHQTAKCHVPGYGTFSPCLYTHYRTNDVTRSRRVTVPNLGGYVGASMRYQNAKVSFGYRADTFYGAVDSGQAAEKNSNRGFYGPFMNVTIGFGG